MNKIFKKIWSESRGCFVVVSETASSISRSKGKVTSLILVTFLAASNVFALTTHNGNVELGTLRDGEKRTLVDSFVINGNATANTPELYISWTSKNFRGMENQSLLVNGSLDSSSPLFVIVLDFLPSINEEDSYRFSDSRSLMSKLPRRVSASAGLPKGVQLGFCTFSKRSFTCLDTTVYSFRSHISPQT